MMTEKMIDAAEKAIDDFSYDLLPADMIHREIARAAVVAALAAQEAEETTYQPWGRIERGTDGELAIYSPKFNTVKARITKGSSVGLRVGEILYRLSEEPRP